jgi:hypothetical protein
MLSENEFLNKPGPQMIVGGVIAKDEQPLAFD